MSAHYDNTEAASKLENGQLLAVLTRIAVALEDQSELLDNIHTALVSLSDAGRDQSEAIEGVANRIEDLTTLVGAKF